MIKQILTILIALTFPCLVAFNGHNLGYIRNGYRGVSSEAMAYFEQAFTFIKDNAYFRKHVDFSKIKREALLKMENAQSFADTHEAIRYLLAQLADRHSFFQPVSAHGGSQLSAAGKDNHLVPFESAVIDGVYGVIKLKSYNSVNQANSHRISDSLYTCLADFGTKHVRGVIIDLREMEGGTYVPFLTGLAPLIDADKLLGFVDRRGKKSRTVRYKNGIYYQVGRKKSRLGYLSRYDRPAVASLPVAVLTGKYTASAGEMILLSFKGLARARTFGALTYGVPTGKANVFLPDSSMISLTNTACFDRRGQIYTSSIRPDSLCPESQAMDVAKSWLDRF